jgi:ribosomal protein L28
MKNPGFLVEFGYVSGNKTAKKHRKSERVFSCNPGKKL